MKLNKPLLLLLPTVSVLLLSGCAMVRILMEPPPNMNPEAWKPPLPSGAARQTTSGSRPLRQDDTVEVRVRSGRASSMIEIADVVDAFGHITLPHLGEFRVGQLTASEAEQAIRDAYVAGGLFTSPEVTLVCPNMIQTPEFFVSGAIAKKGTFPFRDGITLWQAIVAAGDVTDFAGSKVRLIRGGVTEIYDIGRIKSGRVKDPLLMPGDIIEVLESWL